jgi:hypothetical protein
MHALPGFYEILTPKRASPHPAAMYWGDELVAIYNEAYIGKGKLDIPRFITLIIV